MNTPTLRWLLAIACLAPAACGTNKPASQVPENQATSPSASSGEVHSTVGTIESVSADRTVARIHHETIPGYMQSMVMPFEAGTPATFEGLQPGDKVEFSFEERDDGRRVVRSIKKR